MPVISAKRAAQLVSVWLDAESCIQYLGPAFAHALQNHEITAYIAPDDDRGHPVPVLKSQDVVQWMVQQRTRHTMH